MTTAVADGVSRAWNNTAAWVGGAVPTSADPVTIPSGAVVTLPVSYTAACRSLDVQAGGSFGWTAGTVKQLEIGDASGGGLVFSPLATISMLGSSIVSFLSTSTNGGAGWTISVPGQVFNDLRFLGVGGRYNITSDLSTGNTTMTAGTLDFNGNDFTYSGGVTINGATLNMAGGSTFFSNRTTAGSQFSFASGTINGAPNITLLGAGTSIRTFALGNGVYGTIDYTVAGSTGALVLNSGGFTTVDTINFSDATNARTLTLGANSFFAVNHFNVFGASGRAVTVNSTTSGTAVYLHLTGTSPTASTDWLSMQDVFTAIPYTGYYGANTTVGTGCSGCFTATRPSLPNPVAAASQHISATSATVTFPNGHVATLGNLLILVIDITGNDTSFVAPSGWTAGASVNTGTNTNSRIYWKISDGTETAATISHSGSTSNILLHMYEVYAQGWTVTAGATATGSTTAGTSLTVGSAAIGGVGVAVVGLQGNSSLGTATTADQGFIQGRPAPTTAATSGRSLLLVQPTATTVNPTITWTTSRSVRAALQVFEFAPAAAPTGDDDMFFMAAA